MSRTTPPKVTELWSPTSEELLSHLGHCWAKPAGAAPKGVIAPILRNEHYRLFSHSRLLTTFSSNTKKQLFLFCLYHHFRQMMVKKEKSWWRWRRWWWLRRTRKRWIRRWLREQLPILSPSPSFPLDTPCPPIVYKIFLLHQLTAPWSCTRYYPFLLCTNHSLWIHRIACCDCVVCLLTCLPKQYNIIWDINCSLVR